MPKINILPKHIANLIAAGEVVERPASVIKELMENAVDAGATAVTVEIKRGGVTYIRITDNGCGIMRDDIRNAFKSHATSKIRTEEDLTGIGTLGFRGEALASVAAVSKVDVLTCTADDEIGTLYKIEGSEEKLLDDAGCPKGTTIVVRDLFYNTPARMKFLKKDVTEGNAVAGVVDRIALSHPEVSVRFIRDDKQQLVTSGNGKLDACVYSVFGKDFANGLIETKYELDGVKVDGLISLPRASRANRSMQFFFLNGRLVKSITAQTALEQAYKNAIMVGKFPACVLNIYTPLDMVDVNVHPAKTEVRFENEKRIFDAVYYAAKSAIEEKDRPSKLDLTKMDLKSPHFKENIGEQVSLNFRFASSSGGYTRPEKTTHAKSQTHFESQNQLDKATRPDNLTQLERITQTENQNQFVNKPQFENETQFANSFEVLNSAQVENQAKVEGQVQTENKTQLENETHFANPTQVEKSTQTENFSQTENQTYSEKTSSPENETLSDESHIETIVEERKNISDFRVIGEAFSTYIFVECEGKILLIDKHAAHERMLFEKLKSEAEETKSQVLLSPVTVMLSKEEYSAVLSAKDLLMSAGWNIDDFGQGCVVVRECPVMLIEDDIKALVEEMAGYLLDSHEPTPEKLDWIYHNTACRAAIKGGDRTTEYELTKFVEKLLADPEIRYCPHGRPVMVEMSRSDLEKQFGRIV